MAAEITFNQTGGAGAGVPGARNDIWLDVQVDMVSSGTGASWQWTLLDKPPGSSATITNDTASTANITPDAVGTYRIELEIDGSESIIKVIRARYDDTGALASRGWALPARNEEEGEADYPGNARDWAEPWETITTDIRSNVFEAAGDLSGSAADQTVSYLQDMLVPPAEGATANNVLVTGNAVDSPRPIVADGSDMWVGDHKQSTVIDGVVVRFEPVSGTPPTAKIAATVDLTAVDSNVDGVRDLAVDSTYVYAAGWNAGTIAIISRATNAIVGWGTIYVTAVGSSRAISVTADDAGKFYVVGLDEAGADTLFRFDTTACIGATPGGGGKQGPEATQALVARRREIRYGGGFLWLTNGGNDADALWKHDPSTLGSLGSFTGDGYGMSVLYAFGSVWVTDQGEAGVVYRVNPTTLGQMAAVSVTGSQPNGIGLGPNDTGTAGAKIFVTDNGSTGVSVIDPGTSLEDTTVAVTQDDNDGVASFENAAFVTSRDIGAGTEGVSLILGDSSSFTVSDVSLLELFYGLPVLPSNSLVFQPGGTPDGNVFDDWSLLMAEFGTLSGPVVIQIDDSNSAASIPSGSWDLNGLAVLVGTREGNTKAKLTLDAGSLLLNPAGFERLTLDGTGSNGYIEILSGDRYFLDCDLTSNGVGIIYAVGGSILRLINTTVINNGSDVISSAGGTVSVFMQGFGAIQDDTLWSTGNFDVYIQSTGAQTCSTIQTNLAGSLTVIPYGFAAGGDLSGTAISQTVIKLQNRDVVSTAPNDGEVLTWSTGNTRWEPAAPSGGGGTTMDVVLADFTQADQIVFLGEYPNSASPEMRAFLCSQATKSYNNYSNLESGGGWSAPTQPYAFDACALRSDVFLVAYQYGTSLRIRAVQSTFGVSPVVGTAVDLAPDGGSNDVAYVSVMNVITQQKTYIAGVIAWVNPVTSNGWIVPVKVVGTTVTAGTPINFTTTGCLGTAVTGLLGVSPSADGVLAWADVNSNSGLSQAFRVSSLDTTPSIAMLSGTGAPYTFTAMVAADIGQPTLRGGTSTAALSIMFGVTERRVRVSYVNVGSGSGDVLWYQASREARVDGYNVYGTAPGYILDAAQYGTGDFFNIDGDGALLVTGTRTGFEDYLYQVRVHCDTSQALVNEQSMVSHTSEVIGGGLPSGPLAGAAVSLLTVRAVGQRTCAVAAVSDNAGGTPCIIYGWGYLQGGTLHINLQQPYWGPEPLLGAQPQHAAALFKITEQAFGYLESRGGGTNYLRLHTRMVRDPRLHFTGVLQTQGNAGDTRTISLVGNEHTFTTLGSAPFTTGQEVYVKPNSNVGFYQPGVPFTTSWSIGIATDTNKAIIKAPVV